MSCLRKKEALQRLAEIRDVVKKLPDAAKAGRMYIDEKQCSIVLRGGIEAAANVLQSRPVVICTDDLPPELMKQFVGFPVGRVMVYQIGFADRGMRRLVKKEFLQLMDRMRRVVENLPEDAQISNVFIVNDEQGVILKEGIERAAAVYGKGMAVLEDMKCTEFLKAKRFAVGVVGVFQTAWEQVAGK